MKSGYRTDIDGLRAIAVLAVVLFHINPALVPGGFAGVDIFFVISGFLLTSIIHREKTAGTFSYANFYLRRIRRIVPALFVVVCATLLAGQFILLPQHLVELSKSAIASMLGAANVFFTYFVDTGYFAEDSATKPLLHIWSLGVEEQFYLIWPAAALFLVTSRRPLTIAIAVTLCLVLLSEWLVRIDTNFAYYMLPARAFELMIGASLAFVSYRPGNARTANVIGLAGLALIAVSLVFIDESWTFPGINALPSTLGAALVILSGSAGATLVSRALSIKPMRDIGKISYSLYLWHWPIVAFLHYAYVEITPIVGALAFLVMLSLSALSFRLVEVPFRQVGRSVGRDYATRFALPTSLICIAAGAFILTRGVGFYHPTPDYEAKIISLIGDSRPAHEFREVCQKAVLAPNDLKRSACRINGKSEPAVLLWGDSNAAHYVGMLSEIAKAEGFAFRNFSHTGCPPLLSEGENIAYASLQQSCKASLALAIPALNKYEVIIIAGAWSIYSSAHSDLVPALQKTIEALRRSGKRVIILGQPVLNRSLDVFCKPKALKMPWLACDSIFDLPDDGKSRLARINADISQLSKETGSDFFDVTRFMCAGKVCSPYLDGQLLYTNSSHLSMAGSHKLGRKIVESGKIPDFFRLAPNSVVLKTN